MHAPAQPDQRSITHTKEAGHYGMKIRPLHDRILVKRSRKRAKTRRAGSSSRTRPRRSPRRARSIAVGNGKVGDDGKKIPLDVKAGDKILFGKYSGSEVKIDDKEYLILREEDVLAILE